jgi:hypothetical protein
MEGVLKFVPVNNNVPPLAAEYQLMVAVSLAVRSTLPVPQRLAFVTTGAAVIALMTALTGILGLGQTVPAEI